MDFRGSKLTLPHPRSSSNRFCDPNVISQVFSRVSKLVGLLPLLTLLLRLNSNPHLLVRMLVGALEQSVPDCQLVLVDSREQAAHLPQGQSGFLWPNTGWAVYRQSTHALGPLFPAAAPSSSPTFAFAFFILKRCQEIGQELKGLFRCCSACLAGLHLTLTHSMTEEHQKKALIRKVIKRNRELNYSVTRGSFLDENQDMTAPRWL